MTKSEGMTANEKGDLLEEIVKFQKKLDGCEVHKMERTYRKVGGRWVSEVVDIFGADLHCLHLTDKNAYIQVSGSAVFAKRKKALERRRFNLEHNDVFGYRYRQTGGKVSRKDRHKIIIKPKNSFIIYMMFNKEVVRDNEGKVLSVKRGWEVIGELDVTMEKFFDIVNWWREKKRLSIAVVTDYLLWDYDLYRVAKEFGIESEAYSIAKTEGIFSPEFIELRKRLRKKNKQGK